MKLKIQVDDSVSQGVYANMVMTSFGETEFILDFIFVQPAQASAKVNARTILNPAQAKRLAGLLKQNIDRYEARFGEIKVQAKPDGKMIH